MGELLEALRPLARGDFSPQPGRPPAPRRYVRPPRSCRLQSVRKTREGASHPDRNALLEPINAKADEPPAELRPRLDRRTPPLPPAPDSKQLPDPGTGSTTSSAANLAPEGSSRPRGRGSASISRAVSAPPAIPPWMRTEGVSLPHFVIEEFEAYLECGRLEYGFLRVKCNACRHEKPVAFSCKRRGFCPSCGARRPARCPRVPPLTVEDDRHDYGEDRFIAIGFLDGIYVIAST